MTATLAPLNANGRAVGISTRQSRPQRVRAEGAQHLDQIRSTERRPSSVLTVIGKKQISATITSFGAIPKPNQTTRIGARSTIGIVCEATSSG